MNVFEINILDAGSTGKIMLQIAKKLRDAGHTVFTVSNIGLSSLKNLKRKDDKFHFYMNGFIPFAIHYKIGGFFGFNGFFSIMPTLRLLYFMKKKKVDLIHLHNIHNFCFNIPLLFHFIKKNHIPVIWTLHDCWTFTGRCPYFVLTKCNLWKKGCHNCIYAKNAYPHTYLDTSRMMWNLKKKWFAGIDNCALITPSQWLADLVKQSFMRDYPLNVINNGIDLSIFKPTESDFRKKFNLQNKKIVLGVAFGWTVRKGLDVFIELAKRLPSDYSIVLVGTDDNVDKLLLPNIISIHQTQNQNELAEIYSSVDVFANPTREEVLGMVNIESLACGTPVITFKTGGSPECIDETCGVVVECDDVDAMECEIYKICEKKLFSLESCLKRSRIFDQNKLFCRYVEKIEKMSALRSVEI